MVSYLTPLTGLSAPLLAQHGMPFAQAVAMLQQCLPSSAILVGQNIRKDVEWLGLKEGMHFEQASAAELEINGVQCSSNNCAAVQQDTLVCCASSGTTEQQLVILVCLLTSYSLLMLGDADDGLDGPVSRVEPAVQILQHIRTGPPSQGVC